MSAFACPRRDQMAFELSINRPCGVVVSAQLSLSDLNAAPALPIASRVLRGSRVDRARRSSLHTTSVSPLPSAAIAFRECWSICEYPGYLLAVDLLSPNLTSTSQLAALARAELKLNRISLMAEAEKTVATSPLFARYRLPSANLTSDVQKESEPKSTTSAVQNSSANRRADQ